jgi:hypothetical protein
MNFFFLNMTVEPKIKNIFGMIPTSFISLKKLTF